jgi:RNA polymerase sigma-70 factor (ECF subfamily)
MKVGRSMNPKGTSLGGSQEAFPNTTIGILRGLDGGPGGLDRLCRKYWRPVYAYVRVAWAKSNEDAKDLAQAFFLWLVEEGALARFDPGRGRLRAFLKVLLQRFVGHQEEALGRLKRGGGLRIFSMDDSRAPDLKDSSAGPEELFDRAWVLEILEAAVKRVETRYASAGKRRAFEVYEAYAAGPEPERPSYGEIARRFDLREAQVKQLIFEVRQDIRREVRSELAQVTGSVQELEEEWHELFGRG